uniref:BCL9 domain-containing protein n=1 Tax=Rhabditophanes sp. KR3021 TaxID=114890 RepID=A0AC35U755_9BILA
MMTELNGINNVSDFNTPPSEQNGFCAPIPPNQHPHSNHDSHRMNGTSPYTMPNSINGNFHPNGLKNNQQQNIIPQNNGFSGEEQSKLVNYTYLYTSEMANSALRDVVTSHCNHMNDWHRINVTESNNYIKPIISKSTNSSLNGDDTNSTNKGTKRKYPSPKEDSLPESGPSSVTTPVSMPILTNQNMVPSTSTYTNHPSPHINKFESNDDDNPLRRMEKMTQEHITDPKISNRNTPTNNGDLNMANKKEIQERQAKMEKLVSMEKILGCTDKNQPDMFKNANNWEKSALPNKLQNGVDPRFRPNYGPGGYPIPNRPPMNGYPIPENGANMSKEMHMHMMQYQQQQHLQQSSQPPFYPNGTRNPSYPGNISTPPVSQPSNQPMLNGNNGSAQMIPQMYPNGSIPQQQPNPQYPPQQPSMSGPVKSPSYNGMPPNNLPANYPGQNNQGMPPPTQQQLMPPPGYVNNARYPHPSMPPPAGNGIPLMSPGQMPQNGIPQMLPNGMPPNSMHPPGSMPPNGMHPNGMLQQGMQSNGMSPSNMQLNGMPPNGMPPNGMLQNGMPQNGMMPNSSLQGGMHNMHGSNGMPPSSMNGMPPPSMNGMPPPSMNGMQPPSMNGMQPPSMNGMQGMGQMPPSSMNQNGGPPSGMIPNGMGQNGGHPGMPPPNMQHNMTQNMQSNGMHNMQMVGTHPNQNNMLPGGGRNYEGMPMY